VRSCRRGKSADVPLSDKRFLKDIKKEPALTSKLKYKSYLALIKASYRLTSIDIIVFSFDTLLTRPRERL